MQARTYEGGNGVKIEDSASGTGKTISVDNGNGLEFGGTGGRQLTVKADETKGIAVSADGVAVNIDENGNLAFDDTTGALKLADNINIAGTLGVTGKATFTAGADMNGQKITNVQNGDISATSKDAINGDSCTQNCRQEPMKAETALR